MMQLTVNPKSQSQVSFPTQKNKQKMIAQWILVDSRLVCRWIPNIPNSPLYSNQEILVGKEKFNAETPIDKGFCF